MRTIILASSSPRRKELLERAGIPFTVQPSHAEEEMSSDRSPADLVRTNAGLKAFDVSGSRPGEIVLGADTVVCMDGKILGKPHGRQEAEAMLRMLSGRTHQVYTGIVLTDGQTTVSESVCTDVTFRPLSEPLIRRYLDTGEYKDKAGAYGIQGYGCILVEKLSGDYFNVMGLPVARVYRLLEEFPGFSGSGRS